MLDYTTVSLYSYIWTQRDDLYKKKKKIRLAVSVCAVRDKLGIASIV